MLDVLGQRSIVLFFNHFAIDIESCKENGIRFYHYFLSKLNSPRFVQTNEIDYNQKSIKFRNESTIAILLSFA